MRSSQDLVLRPVQALEDLSLFCRKGDEHFRALAAHAHEADGGLGVAVGDCLEDDIGSISLRIEPRRLVVSVAAALAVVHNDHYRFEHHLGRLSCRSTAGCRSCVYVVRGQVQDSRDWLGSGEVSFGVVSDGGGEAFGSRCGLGSESFARGQVVDGCDELPVVAPVLRKAVQPSGSSVMVGCGLPH